MLISLPRAKSKSLSRELSPAISKTILITRLKSKASSKRKKLGRPLSNQCSTKYRSFTVITRKRRKSAINIKATRTMIKRITFIISTITMNIMNISTIFFRKNYSERTLTQTKQIVPLKESKCRNSLKPR